MVQDYMNEHRLQEFMIMEYSWVVCVVITNEHGVCRLFLTYTLTFRKIQKVLTLEAVHIISYTINPLG